MQASRAGDHEGDAGVLHDAIVDGQPDERAMVWLAPERLGSAPTRNGAAAGGNSRP